jgi:hypothetical protein
MSSTQRHPHRQWRCLESWSWLPGFLHFSIRTFIPHQESDLASTEYTELWHGLMSEKVGNITLCTSDSTSPINISACLQKACLFYVEVIVKCFIKDPEYTELWHGLMSEKIGNITLWTSDSTSPINISACLQKACLFYVEVIVKCSIKDHPPHSLCVLIWIHANRTFILPKINWLIYRWSLVHYSWITLCIWWDERSQITQLWVTLARNYEVMYYVSVHHNYSVCNGNILMWMCEM